MPKLLLILFIILNVQAQSIKNLWQARGLEALSKLDSLSKLSKTPKIESQIMIEKAYAFFVTNPDNVIKQSNYHLVFFFEEETLDVAYVYNDSLGLFAIRVDKLPKNSQVMVLKEAAGIAVLYKDTRIFFDINPFSTFYVGN